jgi:hypothetical protein
MDQDTLGIVVGGVILVVVVSTYWWFDRRSKVILQKWAEENRFQITAKKQRYMFFTGPFRWWTNGKNQIIYFVKVRDKEGRERSGWVRCGGYLGGVLLAIKLR